MATHSGVKAHSCYICGAKFARNFYVKVSHLREEAQFALLGCKLGLLCWRGG